MEKSDIKKLNISPKALKALNISAPVCLVLISFIGFRRGIEITDTGYNLGNFTYLWDLDGMWYYSTLFSNFLGRFIVNLPFGGCMLGVGVYLRIIRAVFSLWLYRFLTKEAKLDKAAVFAGLVLALSLCWAPAYGVYHYLSYYVFTIATALLYKGLTCGKNGYLIAAGAVLGLNVFVRFPNVCEAALIVSVWYYCFAVKGKAVDTLKKTGYCILGYAGALVIVFGIIAMTGHLGEYITAIKELFAMTGESHRYGMLFTIRNLVNSYTCVWYWMIPVVIGAIGLTVLGFLPERFKYIYHGIAVLGFAIIYLWFKRTDLFDYNFRSYSSMYLFGVVMLIICIVLMLSALFIKNITPSEKLLCVSALVVIFVTPLGTNNSLYSVINNLFLVYPVAVHVLFKIGEFKRFNVLRTGLATIFLIYIVHMFLFGTMFTFREKQPRQDTYVYNNPVMAGMKTSREYAKLYTDISDLWGEKDLEGARVLSFGDVPGFAYYMRSKPAISSTWPSLDSYSNEKFEKEMERLKTEIQGKGYKVVVITDFYLDKEGYKQEILKNFLNEYNYTEVYDGLGYKFWLPGSGE